MRTTLRYLARQWIMRFGSPLRDEETGELLGRAFVVVWRGRIHLIGYTGDVPLKAVFCSQNRVRYWRQSIGFTKRPMPDFPKLPER